MSSGSAEAVGLRRVAPDELDAYLAPSFIVDSPEEDEMRPQGLRLLIREPVHVFR